MGRMTQPLLTVNRRDKRRPVQGGGGGGEPGTGEALLWNPGVRVPLTNPVTINVPSGSSGNTTDYSITLGAGSNSSTSTSITRTEKHAIIILPTGSKRHGPIKVTGSGSNQNCRVWMVGGNMKKYSPQTSRLLHFQGIDHVYIEGLWLECSNLVGSAIVMQGLNGGAGWLWAQNNLITGVNYADTTNCDFTTAHGDLCIYQSSCIGGVRWYKNTGWYWNTGFIWTGDTTYPTGYPQGIQMIKCDWNLYDNRYNPKPSLYTGVTGNSNSHQCFFMACNSLPITMTDVYLWDDQPTTSFSTTSENGNCVVTHSKKSLAAMAGMSSCRTVAGDTYLGTVTLTGTNRSGVITGGIPPNGHWVNSGTIDYGAAIWPNATGPVHSGNFDGLNYPQPFSANHPGYLE
jgi:hypothetical protein